MADAPKAKKAKRPEIDQTRWHTAVGDAAPDESALTAAGELRIVEIRWDAHPFEPERFQWFLCHSQSSRPSKWKNIEWRLGLSPLRPEHQIVGKSTSPLPLWRRYQKFLRERHRRDLPNIEQNVMTAPNAAPKQRNRPAASEPPPPPPAAPAPPPAALVPRFDEVRGFLLSEDPLRRTDGQPWIAQVIASLISQHVPHTDATRTFLSTRKPYGIGCLFPKDSVKYARYPTDAKSPEAGTLEMHRRAMRLEGLASELLRRLSSARGEGLGADLAADMAADLGCALARWGGPGACGDSLWREGPGATGSGLEAHLGWMCANRAQALTRCYTVADELNWGLPLLAAAWRVLQERRGAQCELQHVAAEVAKCSGMRLNALAQDKLRLLTYGAHLTVVCRRLQAIAAALEGPLPDGLTVATLDANGAPSPPQDGPTVVPALPFDPALAYEAQRNVTLASAQTACDQRVRKEESDVRELLRGQSVAQSPAVQMARALRERLHEEMRLDSHARAATAHLHPTPSLPTATPDLWRYMQPC